MANRLAESTSPYLLQHKDNPVDWREWGDEAFAEARRREVPVLLSVGYSACHWCHVMAHESFEDEEIAAEMNRLFVNVKVDREERPDVDSVYMEAVQTMTGRGGWPMTVFMTPDGRPFLAGTYYPKVDLHGMPSFRRVIAAVDDAWNNKRVELFDQADRLTTALTRPFPEGGDLPGEETLEAAYRAIESTFDGVNGGFGDAPKFPQQPVLEFLLRVRREPWAARADEMLEVTLHEMADGGIHDQLDGGFCRYSVDQYWLVPHFEKMLYDNAQLARIYLWAGIELGISRFLAVCRSTLDYMIGRLGHAKGGFFSAEDADSEGVEGKFYVWTPAQLEEALGPEDAGIAAEFFGVTPEGNFEDGNSILHRSTGREMTPALDSIRSRLLDVRDTRIRPGLDDKVIASWNGLAIRALAESGAALGEARYLEAAEAAARFVVDNLIVAGSLHRSWRGGQTSGPGFVDDHASMAVALYSLYAASGDPRWFRVAEDLVGSLDRFDKDEGGFYTTPSDGETLIKRPTDYSDNPLPSGNALAAEALLYSSLYTGSAEARGRSEGAVRAVSPLAERFPSMVGHHLALLHSMIRGTREVAVAGPEWRDMVKAYWSAFRPNAVLAAGDTDRGEVPLLQDRFSASGATRGFVCRDFVCDLPATSTAELISQLDA
jgi:hypothetical protein